MAWRGTAGKGASPSTSVSNSQKFWELKILPRSAIMFHLYHKTLSGAKCCFFEILAQALWRGTACKGASLSTASCVRGFPPGKHSKSFWELEMKDPTKRYNVSFVPRGAKRCLFEILAHALAWNGRQRRLSVDIHYLGFRQECGLHTCSHGISFACVHWLWPRNVILSLRVMSLDEVLQVMRLNVIIPAGKCASPASTAGVRGFPLRKHAGSIGDWRSYQSLQRYETLSGAKLCLFETLTHALAWNGRRRRRLPGDDIRHADLLYQALRCCLCTTRRFQARNVACLKFSLTPWRAMAGGGIGGSPATTSGMKTFSAAGARTVEVPCSSFDNNVYEPSMPARLLGGELVRA